MAWRVARSLITLRDQFDRRYPLRSRASDGTIGDAAHATRDSDHNPWYGPGIVTAADFTHDPNVGMDIDRLTDELAASRDPRIKYIIANAWILDSRPGNNPWKWVPYKGTNEHRKHLHLSVVASPLCDDPRPWDLPSFRQEDDMQTDERAALFTVLHQLTGSPEPGKYPGWERKPDLTDKPKTLVDYIRALHAEMALFIERREGEPGPLQDSGLGHSATAAGQVMRLQNEFLRFKADTQATLAAILAAVTTSKEGEN